MKGSSKVGTVVFVSFETHHAPWGGLSAVMKRLPPAMSRHVKTVLISPLFMNMASTRKAMDEKIYTEDILPCGPISHSTLGFKCILVTGFSFNLLTSLIFISGPKYSL